MQISTRAALLGLLCCSIPLIAVHGVAAAQSAPKANTAPQVKVVEAERGALKQTFTGYGDLAADRQADIAPRIDGQIASIAVKDGAKVKEGDVILKLDSAVAEADLQAAKAQLEAAKADHKRTAMLAGRGTATQLSLEKATVALAVARTQHALKKAELERYTIRAPFDGQITRISLPKGALVAAGKPLAQIYDAERLRAEFRAPERLWSKLEVGQSFTVQLDGGSARKASGSLTYIAPDADPRSRSIAASGVIDNTGDSLAPGLFVRVQVDLGAKQNLVLIPQKAIIERLSGSYVFVVSQGKAHERKVELGERNEDKVEVVSGVKPGDQVVIDGQKRIRDGMSVSLPGAPETS